VLYAVPKDAWLSRTCHWLADIGIGYTGIYTGIMRVENTVIVYLRFKIFESG
jgi:hypothetical protein